MLFAHKALGHGLYHNWAFHLGWALIPIKPVAMRLYPHQNERIN